LRYVREKNLTTKKSVHVEVMRGVIILTENDNGEVTVDMGAPRFAPADVEFDASNLYFSRASAEKSTCGNFEDSGPEKVWELPLENATAQIGIVSMGNPHAVQVVDNIDTAPVATLGPQIQSHARFAHGVNAGFMQIMNPHEIKLRVYERGSGETLACGTGACAAVASGIARGLLQSPVLVRTRGGDLSIAWAGTTHAPLLMTGPATTVFEGTLDI
jgi:diaminopimelate epimerase